MTYVLSFGSMPWGKTLASEFYWTYTNRRRPLIPHQPWPCPWVTASAADAEPGSWAASKERKARLEGMCWRDDKWTPRNVTVCFIPAGASYTRMSRSYGADVQCFVYLVHSSKHEKSTERAAWTVLFPVVLFPSSWFIPKGNDTSVIKAGKGVRSTATTVEREPRRRRLAECAVRPHGTGKVRLG